MNIKFQQGLEMYKQGKSLTQIGKELHVDRGDLSKFIKSQGIEVHNRQNESEIFCDIFSKIDTEEKAYWLGFLYADGNLSKPERKEKSIEVTLKESDKEHLEKFKKFLNARNKISYRKKQKAYRFSFANKQIYNDLIKLGCVPQKTLVISLPNKKQVPDRLFIHFVRGYFDGDGYLGKKMNRRKDGSSSCVTRMGFTCGSYSFLEDLVKKLNWKRLSITKSKRTNNTYSINWNGKEYIKYLDLLYQNTSVYLERKYKLYLELKNAVQGIS